MEHFTRNTVVHAVFEEMIKLLKEKERIPNKAIAIDTNIDFGIFSKLLSGKKEITELYEHKIYNYLKQDAFIKYSDDLKNTIIKTMYLRPQTSLFYKIWKMSYYQLLDFVFLEMNISDIHFQQQIKVKFFQLLYNKIFQLFQTNSSSLQWVSSNISTAFTYDIPIEIYLCALNQDKHKITVIIDPAPQKFSFNSFNESDNYFFNIHVDTTFLENLHSIETIHYLDNQPITIETINVNQLYVEADKLAHLIFNKICGLKDSFDIL